MGRRAKMLAGLLAAALAAGGSAAAMTQRGATPTVEEQPNILVIEADDQTSQSMFVMSEVRQLLGAQGVTFDNSFVSLSVCCPARSTFLTGQYAHNNGEVSNQAPGGGYDLFKDKDNNLLIAITLIRNRPRSTATPLRLRHFRCRRRSTRRTCRTSRP